MPALAGQEPNNNEEEQPNPEDPKMQAIVATPLQVVVFVPKPSVATALQAMLVPPLPVLAAVDVAAPPPPYFAALPCYIQTFLRWLASWFRLAPEEEL